ncbi:hypothetical protein [Clostridium oryzae]|uniref:Uncharacterized protein n=1 Tax=Clostridium oryzae TaxID=1450648 RepID=A0A1V4INS2_9CLOT|nr:hypothetical protein [Clostridium oryzae]OPJ61681.1 hypothetical protein CLORY_21810 [Clostridium oryzae]
MNDRKYLLDTIKALNNLKQQLKSTHEKILEKAFITADSDADVYYVLQNYTKSDLNIIRKCLGVSCVSTLRKPELASALRTHIINSLNSLLCRLTENEYKLIKCIVNSDGIMPFRDKYSDLTLYLRKLGIVSLVIMDENKFIMIPKDILQRLKYLVNSIEVYKQIKFNENINQLLRGMLYYYGVLDFTTAYKLISTYLDEFTGDMFDIISIIYENYWKDYGIFICNDHLCYDYVDNYHYIVEQQSLRKNIEYKFFTKDELIRAAKDNSLCFNEYDNNFISYLISNYVINKKEAEQITWEIKLDIKNCYDFNEILHETTDCFTISDYEQLKELVALINDVYYNCNQWILKGFSSNELNKIDINNPISQKNKYKKYNSSFLKNYLD